jgi:hypothetical protein
MASVPNTVPSEDLVKMKTHLQMMSLQTALVPREFDLASGSWGLWGERRAYKRRILSLYIQRWRMEDDQTSKNMSDSKKNVPSQKLGEYCVYDTEKFC